MIENDNMDGSGVYDPSQHKCTCGHYITDHKGDSHEEEAESECLLFDCMCECYNEETEDPYA